MDKEQKHRYKADMEEMNREIEKARAEYLKNPPPPPRNYEHLIPTAPTAPQSDAGFVCQISCATTQIKRENIIVVETAITHPTLENFTLLPYLRGSKHALRYPLVKFIIERKEDRGVPPIEAYYSSHLFSKGLLEEEHLKEVQQGASFDPFFWTKVQANYNDKSYKDAKKNWLFFYEPGHYTIQLFYSTKSRKVEDYCRDGAIEKLSQTEIKHLQSLIDQVPAITLLSNTIELVVK